MASKKPKPKKKKREIVDLVKSEISLENIDDGLEDINKTLKEIRNSIIGLVEVMQPQPPQ